MTTKIKDINKLVAEMKTMDIGTDEYNLRWELLIEQYDRLFKKLSRNSLYKEDKEDEYQECILKLPTIIENFDPSKSSFTNYLVESLRGRLQRFRETNHVIAKVSSSVKSDRRKAGKEPIPEIEVSTLDKAILLPNGADGAASRIDLIKSCPANQDHNLLYEDLLSIIKTFKEADIFIDYYINERPINDIAKEKHIGPKTLLFKINIMKNKLKTILNRMNGSDTQIVPKKKYKEYVAEIGQDKIDKMCSEVSHYNLHKIAKKYKINLKTFTYMYSKYKKAKK